MRYLQPLLYPYNDYFTPPLFQPYILCFTHISIVSTKYPLFPYTTNAPPLQSRVHLYNPLTTLDDEDDDSASSERVIFIVGMSSICLIFLFAIGKDIHSVFIKLVDMCVRACVCVRAYVCGCMCMYARVGAWVGYIDVYMSVCNYFIL